MNRVVKLSSQWLMRVFVVWGVLCGFRGRERVCVSYFRFAESLRVVVIFF